MGVAVLLGWTLAASAAVGPAGAVGSAGMAGGAPMAEAGLDQQVLLGETVRLDATGSYDPDGRLVDYRWRVRTPGGRTVPPFESGAARTSFPATAVGRYEVTLTVTDDEGNTGTDTMYVRVGAGGGGDGIRSDAAGATTGDDSTSVRADPDTGASGWSPGSTVASGCSAGTGAASVDCRPSTDTARPVPRVRVRGPPVVTAENSYTYTAETGGLSGERRYEWEGGDVGREHSLRFHSGGEYTTRVTVTDGTGRTVSDRLVVYVASATNERPSVEIRDPGRPAPGETVRLSADASDPDGRVRSTEWSPSRRVRVPEDGSSRTVRVTVTDDDGASVADVITISGRNRTEVATDTTDVTCYFTDERQRDGRLPYSDRCVVENGETVSNSVGPSQIESYRRNPKVDLHWQRTTEDRLSGLEGNDTTTDYGTAAASPDDVADRTGYSDDPVTVDATRRVEVVNDEAFTLGGRTVEDDLTGDGEVNAADWDQRHRTAADLADADPGRRAVEALKRSLPGRRAAEDDDTTGSSRTASASTVAKEFGGAAIDAGGPPDGVADLRHRELAGTGDDGTGSNGDGDDGSGGGGRSEGGGGTDGGGHGTTADGGGGVGDSGRDTADSGGGSDDAPDAPPGALRAVRSDLASSSDTGDDGGPGDTGSAGDSGSTGDDDGDDGGDRTSGGGTRVGAGASGLSMHDPHGGRVVVLP